MNKDPAGPFATALTVKSGIVAAQVNVFPSVLTVAT